MTEFLLILLILHALPDMIIAATTVEMMPMTTLMVMDSASPAVNDAAKKQTKYMAGWNQFVSS